VKNEKMLINQCILLCVEFGMFENKFTFAKIINLKKEEKCIGH